MPLTEFAEAFGTASESIGISLLWILVIALVLNIFLPGGYRYMIIFIRALQIILHLPMMRIIVPGNVSMLMSLLFPIVLFDVLELTEDVNAGLIFQFD